MAEVSRLMTVGLNKSRLCRGILGYRRHWWWFPPSLTKLLPLADNGPPQDYSYAYHLTARSNVTPKQKPSIVSCALCFYFLSERQWDYTLHFQDNGFTTYVGPLKISDFVEATVCWWMIPRGVPMAVYSVSNEQYNNAFTFVQTNILAMKLNVNGRISRSLSTL